MRRVILILGLLVAGCADRAIAPVMPEAAETAIDLQQVFVATTRTTNPEGFFDGDRDPKMRYLSVQVAIPPEHQPGRLRTGGARVDPARDFVISDRYDFMDGAAFTADLRRSLRAQAPGSREAIIYVHGYNNAFADGIFRIAQLRHDIGVKGVSVHYSWPSAAHPLAYTHDRDSMLFARDGLETLIAQTRAAGPERILLVGHSMGGLLVMETLRQMEIANPGWVARNVSGVVLISPDIDIDVFRAQAARFSKLPDPFVIFVSERDRVLDLSARLNGSSARLGNVSDPEEIADLPVTLIDVSHFTDASFEHFALGTSPALLALMGQLANLDLAFSGEVAGQVGLMPGLLLTFQEASELILLPATMLDG